MSIKLNGGLSEYNNLSNLLKGIKSLNYNPNVNLLSIDYPSMATTTLNGVNTRLTITIDDKKYNLYYNRLDPNVLNEKLVFDLENLNDIVYTIGSRLKQLRMIEGDNLSDSPLFSLKLPDNSDATVQSNWDKYSTEKEIKCYLELKPESSESIIFLGTPYCTIKLPNSDPPNEDNDLILNGFYPN